jgi:hypothetical protein
MTGKISALTNFPETESTLNATISYSFNEVEQSFYEQKYNKNKSLAHRWLVNHINNPFSQLAQIRAFCYC